MNTRLLKSKMILYSDEDFISAISKLLNITRQTASAKMNGESDFTQTEIRVISKYYHLSAEDIKNIFVGEDNDNEGSS